MELSSLYGFIVLLIIVGVVLGLGLVLLSTLAANETITPDAGEAINATIAALKTIGTVYLGLIVVVVMFTIILRIVMSSLQPGEGGRR